MLKRASEKSLGFRQYAVFQTTRKIKLIERIGAEATDMVSMLWLPEFVILYELLDFGYVVGVQICLIRRQQFIREIDGDRSVIIWASFIFGLQQDCQIAIKVGGDHKRDRVIFLVTFRVKGQWRWLFAFSDLSPN